MWSNLVVLHTEDKSQSVGELPGYFAWQTCMRSVYVGDARLNGKNPYDFKGRFEIYTGYAAYRALLEIISGMRSRLFGETEVLAQFKERFKATNLPDTAFRAYLIQLHDQLVADCKYIRTHYLTHRGEQSYGGLAHRRLKGVRSVSLLGTGQLAEKVIPWLQKENRNVRVVGRNPERLEHLRERFGVETANLHSFDPRQDALVIAAPVAVQPVMPRIADQAIIIDFREDPLSDE
ncbi:MAG: NAD(P)-binding domain-containing protein, partial [Leptospiraceae bacterium]|nr:NAD(P)-binding domain-containing protein [Leptospiraceae bacterium]